MPHACMQVAMHDACVGVVLWLLDACDYRQACLGQLASWLIISFANPLAFGASMCVSMCMCACVYACLLDNSGAGCVEAVRIQG